MRRCRCGDTIRRRDEMEELDQSLLVFPFVGHEQM